MQNEQQKERIKHQMVICPDTSAMGDRGQAIQIPQEQWSWVTGYYNSIFLFLLIGQSDIPSITKWDIVPNVVELI